MTRYMNMWETWVVSVLLTNRWGLDWNEARRVLDWPLLRWCVLFLTYYYYDMRKWHHSNSNNSTYFPNGAAPAWQKKILLSNWRHTYDLIKNMKCIFTETSFPPLFFFWYLFIDSQACVYHVHAQPSCWFRWSRKPLALPALSSLFRAALHTTPTCSPIHSALTWSPLEHCVDQPCAMLG